MYQQHNFKPVYPIFRRARGEKHVNPRRLTREKSVKIEKAEENPNKRGKTKKQNRPKPAQTKQPDRPDRTENRLNEPERPVFLPRTFKRTRRNARLASLARAGSRRAAAANERFIRGPPPRTEVRDADGSSIKAAR